MGCMMNTLGLGSGRVRGEDIDKDINEDNLMSLAYGNIWGLYMFNRWGDFGCPKLKTKKWTRFKEALIDEGMLVEKTEEVI